MILLIGVACGAIIPALLHGKQATARAGIVGSPAAVLTEVAREAGRISGTTVTVVPLPTVAAGRAGLRSGSLDAVLAGDTEVLVRQRQVLGSSSPGATLAGALSQVGGLQKLYAQRPPGAAAGLARSGIAPPVHGLIPPTRGLQSRISGLAVAILIYVLILSHGCGSRSA